MLCRKAVLDTLLDLEQMIKAQRLTLVHEILVRAHGQVQAMTLPFWAERYVLAACMTPQSR